MKTLILSSFAIFILFLNVEIFSQSGWVQQPVNTTSSLHGMYFINDNTGWITGDSSIVLNTTNGGTNWVKNTNSNAGTLVSVYFKNQTSGLVGGYLNGHLNGFILKTTTAGIQWNNSSFSGEPYDIFSFGGDTVWASRHDGYVMRSTDFGNTWTSSFILQNLELYTVFFVNNLTGWTGGAVYGGFAYIYKTTDGGLTWFNQFISSNNHFFGIYFINNQTGYACTLGGTIYGTTNGGIDWITKLTGNNNTLFNIKFPDINTGFAVGVNGRILKSSNSGMNWNLQVLPGNVSPQTIFFKLNFRNTTSGWAIGDGGTILKTTNSGEPLGIQQISNSTPVVFKLSQNYPNPFNPSTTIEFDLPKSTYTRLIVYNLIGKEVEVLVDKDLSRGSYKVDFNNSNISSGVYYYKLTTNEFSDIKKFVLLK